MCVSMTGRRLTSLLAYVTTATAGASLLTGCGVLPGTTGGSREPVTVMTWAPDQTRATNMPGMPAMAQTYARWVNSQGGIDGHELRILTCNEHNTSAGAAACARRAVREKAVAVVGSYSQNGRAFMAPLEAAGIPYIGGYGITEDEFTSPLSYPVNGGQASLIAGHGMQLAASCRKVSLVRPDTLAGDKLPELLNSGLRKASHRSAVDIPAVEDAAEYTEPATKARAKAGAEDGCVTAVLGERTQTFFDSFRRLPRQESDSENGDGSGDGSGRKKDGVRISSVLGSVGQPVIDRTGGAHSPFEGAFVTGWYPEASDKSWAPMRKVIQEHAFADNRVDPADAGVQTTWIAYTVLKEVVESLGNDKITATQIAFALDRGARIDTGGLTPALRWKYEDLLGAPGFPRIVNHEVTFQVVRKGQLVAQRPGFVDVGETVLSAP
ncbi:ABC transporter substrate-binding protein [Streptomyces sp. TX20-6-3]|uniref:ABC transporter substrate-binding protein n=1 Tax=Streptomyces sp. TX20-6-3 TaxID=3028705 RepID=UPI0029A6D988|nr:ABC transporter substrate-binding protein [Streptomyces sp. TX20-6-3]MDX2560103.1 ABC transporter substrate-binding protein [Streptomyces sp. TX20-6-3]